MPSSTAAALESQESDAHSEGSSTGLWPLRIGYQPTHITRHILVYLVVTALGVVGLWYSMTTMISSSQVPTFVPQAAVITVPGTNITIPARPAAFGPLISDNTRLNSSIEEEDSKDQISDSHAFSSSRVLAFLGPRVAPDTFEEDILDEMDAAMFGGFTGSLKVIESLGCIEPKFDAYRGKIALVERGGCSFYDKIMVLQRGGAIAVIVGDNVYRRGLVTMYTGESCQNG